MNLRRDPLREHLRCWLAHWVAPCAEVTPRASGTLSFPAGCGITSLPTHIGELDSQCLVPATAPVVLPTADSIARDREQRVRLGAPRSMLPRVA